MRSPSSRRAWIEITFTAYEIYQQPVALLTEGVDRNLKVGHGAPGQRKVALLAEGVDRNVLSCLVSMPISAVALLAEGVDRNLQRKTLSTSVWVALLAEGVDRNYEVSGKLTQGTWSPSSRRAWIEILSLQPCGVMMSSRPPHGGRG